jgi:hypothetical protein
MTLYRMTLNRMTLNRMTLNRMTLNRMTLNIITLNTMTFNRMSLNRMATLQKVVNNNNNIIIKYVYLFRAALYKLILISHKDVPIHYHTLLPLSYVNGPAI